MTPSTKTDTEQRRRSEREPGEAFATISSGGDFGSDQAFCVVIDLSDTGIRLRTPQPPEVGQMVVVRIGIGEEVHSFCARVKWRRKGEAGHDVGLAFETEPVLQEPFLSAVQAAIDDEDWSGDPAAADAGPDATDDEDDSGDPTAADAGPDATDDEDCSEDPTAADAGPDATDDV